MDEIALAQEREQIARADALAHSARAIEPGQQGECEYCGYVYPRILRGACARCRDAYRLDGRRVEGNEQ